MTQAASPWILDMMVGIVLLGCACAKGVKGLYKCLMPLAIIVLSALCAAFLSAVLTEPVTTMVYPTVEDKVISALKIDKLPQTDLQKFADLVTNPSALLEEVNAVLPRGMMSTLTNLGVDTKEFLTTSLGQVQDSVNLQDYLSEKQIEKLKTAGVQLQTAAETAVDSTKTALEGEGVFFSLIFSLTRRLTAIAVHYLLWCIFFVLFLVLLTTIKNTFGIVFKLPIIGWVDKVGGAALGAVEAGVVLFVLGWTAKLFGFTVLHELGTGTVLYHLFF